jgi:hypothetical protein
MSWRQVLGGYATFKPRESLVYLIVIKVSLSFHEQVSIDDFDFQCSNHTPSMGKIKYQSMVLVTSSLVTVTVTALLALAVYVNVKQPVAGEVSTPGFPAINVSASQWNVGCTVLGTAVGILVTAGLAFDDGLLTREAILCKEGVAPFYLRPLTIPRGMDQVRNGWSHATRMFLLFLTIVATLSTTATVAIFGVHNVEQPLYNPTASWPLATILKFKDGPNASPDLATDPYNLATLDAFLFRSAYIAGLNTSVVWKSAYPGLLSKWLPESGSLGDTLYPTLRTSGIGLNLSSYLDYIGSPRIGFDVPATYTFNRLYGDVFGTHIDVTCTDAQHTLTTDSVWNCGGDFSSRYYEIDTQKGVHLALSSELGVLAIGSALIYQRGVPILTIAVPFDWYEAAVYECTYSGNDFVASVSVDSRVSPLRIVAEKGNSSSINTATKKTLADSMNDLLSKQGGGSLVRAWQALRIRGPTSFEGGKETLRRNLEKIFSQMGEALISLSRQDIERADYYKGYESRAANGVPVLGVTVLVTITKLGGGSWGWLSVYILFLMGSLSSIFRYCRVRRILQTDVQDPLRILEMTLEGGQEISLKSRIRIQDKLEVISSSIGLLSNDTAGERS